MLAVDHLALRKGEGIHHLMGCSPFSDLPFFLQLAKHGYGLKEDIAWPAGGALDFARSIENRYKELGGEVYNYISY